jgi:hypothetical protein
MHTVSQTNLLNAYSLAQRGDIVQINILFIFNWLDNIDCGWFGRIHALRAPLINGKRENIFHIWTLVFPQLCPFRADYQFQSHSFEPTETRSKPRRSPAASGVYSHGIIDTKTAASPFV